MILCFFSPNLNKTYENTTAKNMLNASGIIDISPIIPTRGENKAPNIKIRTPKIPDAAPAPPFLDPMARPKPAVWEEPIIAT